MTWGDWVNIKGLSDVPTRFVVLSSVWSINSASGLTDGGGSDGVGVAVWFVVGSWMFGCASRPVVEF